MTDDDFNIEEHEALRRLDGIAALPELVAACASLALVVEDALSPALRGERVKACEHAKVGTSGNRHDAPPVEVERRAYLCPMHPDRLLCDLPGCLDRHYEQDHLEEMQTAGCFVCEKPISQVKCLPVVADVMLHRGIPLAFPDADGFLTNLSLEYRGALRTTAMAWLCHLHNEVVELPLRMAWPTVAPSSVPERPPWDWAG